VSIVDPPFDVGPVIGRRAFLAGIAAAALTGCSGADDEADGTVPAPGAVTPETVAELPPLPPYLPTDVFALGVASGDPLPDAVILWTRIVADPLDAAGGLPDQPLPVHWELAADERFDDVAASGDTVAEPAFAHSVHVDATGLEPDRWYWYRFSVGERVSPVGRTRTAPGGDAVGALRFAFASCQDYQSGYWPAHDHLATEEIDLVVFLGDYVYGDAPATAGVRRNRTPAPADLAGYRVRYGEYKADPALQAAHAHVPWACTWDDNEVTNNYAGDVPAGGADGGADGGGADGGEDADAFRARRAAAYQAWYEHLPVRTEPPRGDEVRVHRSLAWGDLARFYLLDGRQHRSDQACRRRLDLGVGCDDLGDDDRSMLGPAQERWLGDALAGSDARWNIVAQQTVVSRIALPLGDGGEALNLDQWDGYPAARRRLVDQLVEVDNPVVITGDVHASAVGVVTADPDDPGAPAAVPELVGTSISSAFPDALSALVGTATVVVRSIRYLETVLRGYVVCDVTPEALTAEFRYVSSAATATAPISTGARWRITAGDPVPRPVADGE
jgi:alkaline phosphatase D